MGTRATYEIGSTTFYCHWDGYPTGAAQRFANMVKQLTVAPGDGSPSYESIEDRRGGMAFAFIRGNMDAEPTRGRDAHGDTEWHYKIANEPTGYATIRVEGRTWSESGDRWRLKFAGDLAEWLNGRRNELTRDLDRLKNSGNGPYAGLNPEADALESIPVIVRMVEPREYGGGETFTYATLEQARTIYARELQIAEKFTADNPNKASHQRKADCWRMAIEATEPPKEEPKLIALSAAVTEPTAEQPNDKIVRAFSAAGPCLTLGRLVKETVQFWIYDEWRGGERYEGRHKVRKRIQGGHYSRAHIEPCCSCRDHPKTQYPHGYMD